MVSVAPGTSGPLAWYWSKVGESTDHAPGTAGLKVGIGLPGASGVENRTAMVEPPATPEPDGDVEITVSGGGGGSGVADAFVFPDRLAT